MLPGMFIVRVLVLSVYLVGCTTGYLFVTCGADYMYCGTGTYFSLRIDGLFTILWYTGYTWVSVITFGLAITLCVTTFGAMLTLWVLTFGPTIKPPSAS